MTILAQLRARLDAAAAAAGLAPVAAPTRAGGDGVHVEPRGDRFDLVERAQGQERLRLSRLGMDDCAYELVFRAALPVCLAVEAGRGGAPSRWNWMAAHIALMGRVSAAWAERTRRHYRAELERAPLSPAEVAAILPGQSWADEESGRRTPRRGG